jgi:hypothetical protein
MIHPATDPAYVAPTHEELHMAINRLHAETVVHELLLEFAGECDPFADTDFARYGMSDADIDALAAAAARSLNIKLATPARCDCSAELVVLCVEAMEKT